MISFVSHPQLLSLTAQFIHGPRTGSLPRALELQQIGKTNTSVLACAKKGQLSILQELHQVGSGHIEQIGSLLRGQLSVYRHDPDCIAFGQSVENFLHKAQYRDGQFHLMCPVSIIEELNTLGLALAGKTEGENTLSPGGQLDFMFIRQLHAGMR